ncbi:hypothetical protein ACFYKT_13455 [Cytobacillus sp. FJAT-53684]|uniref:Uncharacterized protein n=1 Tax=Cytobacillus mangrovibacter TaxID=3299024 RepID=A0ABW6JZK6_9BACI
MENLFVGYRKNGLLYGCKDYISNLKEETKADEMMKEFYQNNELENISELLNRISWQEIGEYRSIPVRRIFGDLNKKEPSWYDMGCQIVAK